jgi:hypothetical protein
MGRRDEPFSSILSKQQDCLPENVSAISVLLVCNLVARLYIDKHA